MDWHTLLKDTPALLATVVIVVLFLRAMRERDNSFLSAFNQAQRDHIESLQKLDQIHEEARRHSRDVIEKNTEVLGAVAENIKDCMRRRV